MKQFQGDQSGRLREWVGYSFWACCFYCTFPKSNHFSFDGFSFRFEWIFPLYISYRSPGQFSIGSQQSSNRFTPTLPKKRKTKPTHTFSSARTVQEDRNIARELEGVRKRVRQFERVFFLCANINLFNLQVFIIYLVRCYILWNEMKITLLSHRTRDEGRQKVCWQTVTDSGHIRNGENGKTVNHGENHDIPYSSQNHSIRILHVYTGYIRKLTEKIIVVPFKYVLMFFFSPFIAPARNERTGRMSAAKLSTEKKNECRLMCHFWSFIYANAVFFGVFLVPTGRMVSGRNELSCINFVR